MRTLAAGVLVGCLIAASVVTAVSDSHSHHPTAPTQYATVTTVDPGPNAPGACHADCGVSGK